MTHGYATNNAQVFPRSLRACAMNQQASVGSSGKASVLHALNLLRCPGPAACNLNPFTALHRLERSGSRHPSIHRRDLYSFGNAKGFFRETDHAVMPLSRGNLSCIFRLLMPLEAYRDT